MSAGLAATLRFGGWEGIVLVSTQGLTFPRAEPGRSEQGHPLRHNGASRGGGFRVTGGVEAARRATERAAYEATRAERAHRAADPENRRVARGPWREWEQRLD